MDIPPPPLAVDAEKRFLFEQFRHDDDSPPLPLPIETLGCCSMISRPNVLLINIPYNSSLVLAVHSIQYSIYPTPVVLFRWNGRYTQHDNAHTYTHTHIYFFKEKSERIYRPSATIPQFGGGNV